MPILISLDGNIGAGKSTLLNKLRELPNVKVIDEPVGVWEKYVNDGKNLLELFYEDKSRWAYTFQNAAIITRLQNIQNTMKENPGYDIFVTERSILTDKYVFADMLHNSGSMNDLEWSLYNTWFDTYGKDVIVTGVVWLDVDPDTCIERIRTRNRKGEEEIPLEYLHALEKQHQSWLLNTDLPVLRITSNERIDQMMQWIYCL
jgi:deoxyadenosine/deoxycytidine kinase